MLGDLGIDLVGCDLEEGLIHLDGVANGLEP